jgi:hypothetical protein
MKVSIRRIENQGFHVIRADCIWEPATDDKNAFIDEYLKMEKYGFDFGGKLINKIMSPGKKYYQSGQ